MLKVKVFSNTVKEYKFPKIVFSTNIKISEADGVFAYASPVSELLHYTGVKAWCTFESLKHSRFSRNQLWRDCYKNIKDYEFLHYSQRISDCKIPHYTSGHSELFTVSNLNPSRKAVALVSNFGGNFWGLKSRFRLRNKFILSKSVALYGQENSWKNFRNIWGFGIKKKPCNYYGEPKVRWHSTRAHLEYLSRFNVIVCMESFVEPFYFTEKFVNAARAGCIPVYHAHPTVRDGILKGASWVDPVAFKFDPELTIEFALDQNIEDYREKNWNWLKKDSVIETTEDQLWEKIYLYFLKRFDINQN